MSKEANPSPKVAGPREPDQVIEHLFRHEAGKMVATLTRIFGIGHLTLAEDVVQEALVRALQTWPFYGIPQNPAAWLMKTARNLALDAVRRQKVFHDKEPELIRMMEKEPAQPGEVEFLEPEITDDRLRLMFVCCHPVIPAEAQVALILKTLCGFSGPEIASAFLTTDAAIAKRLSRAKRKIVEAKIAFEIPAGEELKQRLNGVLQSLYLMFNEGYKASSGDQLIRQELCEEAIRLAALLNQHPAGRQPKTHALLALMFLNAARVAARVDDAGNLLRLCEQDRHKWDQQKMARGMWHLAQSAAGKEMSPYHLQAGIAACHCAAKDYASTNWQAIVALYDQLLICDDSPVVALNRAVALGEWHGPQAGLDAVNAIPKLKLLESYYLLPAVLGNFELQLDHRPQAAAYFCRALQLAETQSEQSFLTRRLRECHATQTSEAQKNYEKF